MTVAGEEVGLAVVGAGNGAADCAERRALSKGIHGRESLSV